MVKWVIGAVLIGVVALLGLAGNNTYTKKVTKDTLAGVCAESLASLNSKVTKNKNISFGEFHDYIHKRTNLLSEQVKTKKIKHTEYQAELQRLFSTYAETSMKTCQSILDASYQKCRNSRTEDSCARESMQAFSFGLRLVVDDSLALKQNLDLSRIVAFDIRTAMSQERSRMPASEKKLMQTYASFLQ